MMMYNKCMKIVHKINDIKLTKQQKEVLKNVYNYRSIKNDR